MNPTTLPPSLLLQPTDPNALNLALEELKNLSPSASQTPPTKPAPDLALDRNSAKKLASIATTIWRMSKRISEKSDSTQEENPVLAKINHDTQSLREDLESMGVTIWDKTGQLFDYGMPEKVIDVKQQIGISKERVLETLRPTITWKSGEKTTILQVGEVIIQTPAK